MQTADQPVTPAPASPVKPLPDRAIKLAEQCYRTWHFDLGKIKAEDGTSVSLQDFMRPTFWSKWIDKIGVDDRIRVIAADRSFDFELIVKAKQQGVGLLLKIDRSKENFGPPGLSGSCASKPSSSGGSCRGASRTEPGAWGDFMSSEHLVLAISNDGTGRWITVLRDYSGAMNIFSAAAGSLQARVEFLIQILQTRPSADVTFSTRPLSDVLANGLNEDAAAVRAAVPGASLCVMAPKGPPFDPNLWGMAWRDWENQLSEGSRDSRFRAPVLLE